MIIVLLIIRVVNLFADMLIQILQVIWIREGQHQGMSLLLQVEL